MSEAKEQLKQVIARAQEASPLPGMTEAQWMTLIHEWKIWMNETQERLAKLLAENEALKQQVKALETLQQQSEETKHAE